MAFYSSEPTRKAQEIILLPGISYIPDKIEVQEKPDLMNRIETEFVDFLCCVTDLLKLMHLVKAKYLRSMTPMPHNILREMRELNGKGPLLKKYDKQVAGNIPGISPSAESIFKRGMSSVSAAKAKPAIKKTDVYKKKPLEADLVEITGKKTKPMWHVVALEKPPDPLVNPEDVPKEEPPPCSPLYILSKKDLPLSRTQSEEMIVAIRYLNFTSVRPKDQRVQDQMDMLAAADLGFKTVEEYKIYLDTLKPHWYKDLLQDAIKIGVVTSVEVVDEFENLGQFYNMTPDSLPLARAKLSFVIMSLPIWDVARMAMQMATNFILYNILKSPKSHNYLLEWLNVRKLPYVAFPPIHADMLELISSQAKGIGNTMKGKTVAVEAKSAEEASKEPALKEK